MVDLRDVLTALDAIRDLVATAEEQGWDTTDSQGTPANYDLREVLDRGREAYATLRQHFGASETDTAVVIDGAGRDDYAPQAFARSLRTDD